MTIKRETPCNGMLFFISTAVVFTNREIRDFRMATVATTLFSLWICAASTSIIRLRKNEFPGQQENFEELIVTTPSPLPGTDVCGTVHNVRPKRVVNGVDATVGSFPWLAAIGYKNRLNSYIRWLCGGSLVTSQYVITAAHCRRDVHNVSRFIARLGDLDLQDGGEDGAAPRDYEFQSWIVHPEYNKYGYLQNDISIVKLKISVTFTLHLQPLCLPTLEEFKAKDFVGHNADIAGWGYTKFGGPQATRLQNGRVQIWHLPVCQKAYNNSDIKNTQVCAYGDGVDTCNGDTGTPLMLKSNASGDYRYYLYGITSYGISCAAGFPGVYTLVPKYMDWILKNLKSEIMRV